MTKEQSDKIKAVWTKANRRALNRGYEPMFAHHVADMAVKRLLKKEAQ